jgi:hypothetical protein
VEIADHEILLRVREAALASVLKVEEGDIIFFAAGPWEKACGILGRVRQDCAVLLQKRGKLVMPPDQWNFLWVVDFPLMSYDEERGGYAATHHPFTAPVAEDIALLDSDPKAVRGQHYDVVLNGMELGGGSIRIHQPELQRKVFEEVLKIPSDIVETRFGYMLRAFRYGAPPHGRPDGRAALRHDEHPRRDCVSKNAKGTGSHGGESDSSDGASAARPAHRDGRAAGLRRRPRTVRWWIRDVFFADVEILLVRNR